jgi:hypothetical protein
VGNDPVNGVDALGLSEDKIVHIKMTTRNSLSVNVATGKETRIWDTRALPGENGDAFDWTGVVDSRAWLVIDKRKYEKLVRYVPRFDEFGLWDCWEWVEISREEAVVMNYQSPEMIRVTGEYKILWDVRKSHLDKPVTDWATTLILYRDEIHSQIAQHKTFTQNLFLGEAAVATIAAAWSVLRLWSQAVGESSVAARNTTWIKNRTPWQRTVYQRSDIEWNLIRPQGVERAGITNRQAAAEGYAPVRINCKGDPEKIFLHHLNQDPRGGVAEMWSSTHGKVPHKMDPPGNWRVQRPDWAAAWNDEQSAYWRWRMGTYNPKPTERLRLPGD